MRKEKLHPDLVCQISCAVITNQLAQRCAAVHILKEIIRIHISVKISLAEGVATCNRNCIKKILVILRPDLVRHLIDSSRIYPRRLNKPHKVTQIACPASEILRILVLCMIGHVHTSEHMPEIHLVAVRESEILKIPKSLCRCSISLILIRHIRNKCCIFRAAEGCPGAGRISLNTRTNIINNQTICVFTTMLFYICICICFKCGKIRQKILVRGYTQCFIRSACFG